MDKSNNKSVQDISNAVWYFYERACIIQKDIIKANLPDEYDGYAGIVIEKFNDVIFSLANAVDICRKMEHIREEV